MGIDLESQATLDEVVDRLGKLETQVAGVALGQLSKDVSEILAALEGLKAFIKTLTVTVKVG